VHTGNQTRRIHATKISLQEKEDGGIISYSSRFGDKGKKNGGEEVTRQEYCHHLLKTKPSVFCCYAPEGLFLYAKTLKTIRQIRELLTRRESDKRNA